MEVSGETTDEDLRAKMQNNIQLCEQSVSFMKENVIIRISALASQLALQTVNVIRGEPVDLNILHELSQLSDKYSTSNFEHESVVRAFKNFVMFVEIFLKNRRREAQTREGVENVYDGDQYSVERSPPRYLVESPKRPKYEVGEEMDSIGQEIANSEVGRQSYLEDNDGMELEDTKIFEVGKGQTEDMFEGSQSMRIAYEEKDEEPMNDGLRHVSSTRRAKYELTLLTIKKTPVKRISLDVKKTTPTPSTKVVGTNGRMVDKAWSLTRKKDWEDRMFNNPLCKTAAIFCLTTNNLKCPFCEGTFGVGGLLDKHLKAMHTAERHNAKLFGCDKCDSWCGLPNTAMSHHREKGCTLRIRSVDEAKKWNALRGIASQSADEGEFDGNVAEGDEISMSRAAIPAEAREDTVASPTIDCDMASRVNVITSDSNRVMSMSGNNEERSECDKIANNEKEE